MAFKIDVADDAYAELMEIHAYITSHDSLEKADSVLRRIESAIDSLADTPHRGNHPPELLDHGNREFREIFFKPYRIIYKVSNHDVYILLIADGRRDLRTLLLQRLTDVSGS